jgi:hypothetical protein
VVHHRPRHEVPRLDAPERIGPLPASLAKWLGAGVVSGPLLSQLLAVLSPDYTLVSVWNLPVLWLFWGLIFAGCATVAFVRPGGLHLAQWWVVLVDFHLRQRKAVWR